MTSKTKTGLLFSLSLLTIPFAAITSVYSSFYSRRLILVFGAISLVCGLISMISAKLGTKNKRKMQEAKMCFMIMVVEIFTMPFVNKFVENRREVERLSINSAQFSYYLEYCKFAESFDALVEIDSSLADVGTKFREMKKVTANGYEYAVQNHWPNDKIYKGMKKYHDIKCFREKDNEID